MDHVISTGPGFYAGSTASHDDTVPAGKIRLFFARIEIHDGPLAAGTEFDAASFKLLPAMAEDDKRVARALVQLHNVLQSNLPLLKDLAR